MTAQCRARPVQTPPGSQTNDHSLFEARGQNVLDAFEELIHPENTVSFSEFSVPLEDIGRAGDARFTRVTHQDLLAIIRADAERIRSSRVAAHARTQATLNTLRDRMVPRTLDLLVSAERYFRMLVAHHQFITETYLRDGGDVQGTVGIDAMARRFLHLYLTARAFFF